MSEPLRLKLLVDDPEKFEIKGALPTQNIYEIFQRTVDIGLEELENRVNESLERVLNLLSRATLESNDYEVNSVRFTLRIDASGEVSLVSLAKGSLGGQTGLEFTLTRKQLQPDKA